MARHFFCPHCGGRSEGAEPRHKEHDSRGGRTGKPSVEPGECADHSRPHQRADKKANFAPGQVHPQQHVRAGGRVAEEETRLPDKAKRRQAFAVVCRSFEVALLSNDAADFGTARVPRKDAAAHVEHYHPCDGKDQILEREDADDRTERVLGQAVPEKNANAVTGGSVQQIDLDSGAQQVEAVARSASQPDGATHFFSSPGPVVRNMARACAQTGSGEGVLEATLGRAASHGVRYLEREVVGRPQGTGERGKGEGIHSQVSNADVRKVPVRLETARRLAD